MKRCAIAVDLGGTNCRAALVDGTGRILAEARRPTPVSGGPTAVLDVLADLTRTLKERAVREGLEVLGAGLGIPGLVDSANGVSRFSPNLFWHDVPVVAPLREALGIPVFMENDVRCAALGERHFGAGRGLDAFLCVTVGTGIGSGIILNGRLYTGPRQMAGEIGHIFVAPDGPTCNCGRTGCLEAVASASALARFARQGLEEGAGGLLRVWSEGHPDRVDAALVARAAAEGDEWARSLLMRAGRYLGVGLAIAIDILGPMRVVVGGGLSQAGDLYLDAVREALFRHVMPPLAEGTELVPAACGPAAGILGAATLVPGLVEEAQTA